MASLRKDSRGKSPYWFACITVPGVGQTQRSTKIKASERLRSEALALAEKWERQAKLLGPATHLQNRDAILEAFIGATQQAVTGDLSEASAREVLDRIMEATGQGVIKQESVRVFSLRWLQARKHEVSSATYVAYEHAVSLFLTHLGSMADKLLGSVTTPHIESFKAARIAAGLSAKTVDRDLKVVRSLFQAALDQGLIRFDPSRACSRARARQNLSE